MLLGTACGPVSARDLSGDERPLLLLEAGLAGEVEAREAGLVLSSSSSASCVPLVLCFPRWRLLLLPPIAPW